MPVGLVIMLGLRLSSRRAGIALMYHSVEEQAGDPERELVPAHAARLFDRQIRYVARHFRIVDAGDLQAAAQRRRRGERFPVAITFDDDLACHVSVALPILERRRATATFFLSGASLDQPFSFWWERLQRAFDSSAVNVHELVATEATLGAETSIHALGLAVEELEPDARDRVAQRLSEIGGPDPADSGVRSAGVRALAEAGMTIGFHTRRHDAMTPLTDERLHAALVEGRAELAEAAGRPVEIIGYPHGKADARVARASAVAGFRTGFTTLHVAVTPADDPLLLGRVGPSLRSVGALAVQIAHALLTGSRRREAS